MVKADETPKSQPVINTDWRVHDQNLMKPILAAALDAIVEVGYHGTSIRKIADRAGLSVPGVYHHYSSKHALLVGIMEFGMEDLWVRTQAAITEAGGDITKEFELYVECMVLFHASRPELAWTALNEIRSWMLNHETYIFNVETASTACWMRSLTMAATRDCLPPLILGKQAPPSSQCAPVLPSGFVKTGN